MAREANLSGKQLEEVLISAAIKIGSEEGIEKIKTRTIEAVSGVNQAYIYQCYSGLDELIKCAYVYANKQIVENLIRELPIFLLEQDDTASEFEQSWCKCWQYLIDNIDLCRYCLRLRFSASYENSMAKIKLQAVQDYLNGLEPSVREKYRNNLTGYMNVLDVIKLFVVKAADGEIPDSEGIRKCIFNVISYAFLYGSEGITKYDGERTPQYEQSRASGNADQAQK